MDKTVTAYLIGADESTIKHEEKWGFLREHSNKASGKDSLTGLHRTGLDKYLEVIFPTRQDTRDR